MRIHSSKPNAARPTQNRQQPSLGHAQVAGRVIDNRNRDAFEGPRTNQFGVDTNSADMTPEALAAHGAKFVARYLSNDGTHPQLTPAEAQRFQQAGVPLVAVWETGRQDHVLAGGSLANAFKNGVADAKAAAANLAACGGAGKPIYFTVDFNVNSKDWDKKIKDPSTGKVTTEGALIKAYFAGIRSVLPQDQVGAYGSYTTVHNLFDSNTIGYGWQQTFGGKHDKVDPRAQLRQYDIYPSQDGWGVSGAGALDYDRAVRKNFGQW